jgi:RecB family exonuclease
MVARYLGDERRRAVWPDVERVAAERVEAALDRLAGLDRVEPGADVEVFTRTLQLELDDDLGRVGNFGRGVLVGTMSAALGVDLDVVIVLGLAEGVCPSRVREDSLLPDIEREVVREELSLRAERIGAEHRQLLAALAGADHRVLVYPRGDLRRSMVRPPSRWLLDCCETATGNRALPSGAAWYRDVPSFAHRAGSVPFPATRQEYGVRALHSVARRHLARHPLVAGDTAMSRSVELLRLRGGDDFTRFDGNLEGVDLPSPEAPRTVLTATQLEGWLGCPHAYFMQYVLRVKPVENPEELLTLEPMERGTLMHDVLERWLLLRIAEGPPPPTAAWSDAARADMRRLAEEECDTAERRGITGHPLLWQRDREVIVRDLLAFVDADDERRAALGLTPVAAEQPFGLDGGEPLVVDVGDGTVIRLRGRIDRIDRTQDGKLVVTDFKTGSAKSYKGLTQEQPLADGSKLQLALYGLAMSPDAGAAGVRSEYWFTSSKGEFKRVGYDLDDNAISQLQGALQIIAGGLRRGLFPLKPVEPGWRPWTDCRFCDPDDLGTADRYREWETLRHAPQLRDYVAYVEPEALEDEVPA